MANGFLDLDLDFPKGEIPSTCVNVLNVYNVDEDTKKGWLLDIEIPRKNPGKDKGLFSFIAFYPKVNKVPENISLGSLLGSGGIAVQVTKKKTLMWQINYMWNGKEFIPAPLNSL